MYIAIHGLPDTKDIILTVNHIFDELNLRHISCVSAYRTPARPDMNHHRVVIATLNSLSVKHEVLEQKRYEMSNGDAYFISDNGRIRQTRKVQSTRHSVPYSAGDTYHPSSESQGGARPNNTNYYDNYRNPAFDYGNSYYNSHRSINQNVVPNNIGRKSEDFQKTRETSTSLRISLQWS